MVSASEPTLEGGGAPPAVALGPELTGLGWPGRAAMALGGLGAAGSIVLELLAASSLLRGGPLLAGWLHLLGCSLFALSLPHVLPDGVARPRVLVRLTFFVLGLFLPVVGPLGLSLSLPFALHLRKPAGEEPFVYVRPPPLPLKPLFLGEVAPLRFSQGALSLVLKHAPDPDKRVAAVMALRRMAEVRKTPLLRIALKDPIDDVRLLAYALNDGIDKEINRRIQQRITLLDRIPPAEQARLRKALAQDFWDLAYLGLASGDVEAHVLSEAARHLERVLELEPDGGAAMLLGRVRLRQRRPVEAEAAFQRARSLGLPSVAVGPYRAEAAFLLRRFDEVRTRLAELPTTSRARLPLAEVLRFWLEDKRSLR